MLQHLPVEIVCIIFELCARADVTLICLTWYDIVKALPHLWTTISVRQLEQFSDVAIFERLFALARDLPVHVDVRLPSNEETRPVGAVRAHVEDVARILSWASIHLGSLEIDGQEENHIADFLHQIASHLPEQCLLPSLRRLTLTGGADVDQTELILRSVLPSFLALAPNVHTLTLPCYDESLPLGIQRANILALTTLELHADIDDPVYQAKPNEVLCFLIHVPTIVSVTYITPDSWSTSPFTPRPTLASMDAFTMNEREYTLPVILPHLKHITISAPGGSCLDILQCIKAPCLSTITIQGPQSPIASEIDNHTFRDDLFATVVKLAERSPVLKIFRVHRCPLNGRVFRALFFGGRCSDLQFHPFPVLEHLSFKQCSIEEGAMSGASLDVLLDIVDNPRFALETLVLSSMPELMGNHLGACVCWLMEDRSEKKHLRVEITTCPLVREEDINSMRRGGALIETGLE